MATDAMMNQIRAWFQQNPYASQADMTAAMNQYGIAPADVALAMGNTPIANAPPEIKVAQYQNITQGNSNLTDINRSIVARNLGLSAENLATTGMPLAQAQALTMRAGEQNAVAGKVSDEQIKAYAAANPNMSPSQLQAAMQEYGLSPLQVGRALGQDVNAIRQLQVEGTPTGLLGYEEAMRAGLNQATSTLQGAQQEAAGLLTPQMEEVARLYGLNVEDLRNAGATARGDIESSYGKAGALLNPYQQAGTTALQQQMALSGALGQDAFQNAYVESPYIQFLREQGERSTLAGASATGGLGGGRVQQELVRFGQGLASQGLQQQIQNLSGLSGQGLQAAGSGADIYTAMGNNLATIGQGTAQDIAAQRGALASERSQYGANLSNLASSAGTNIANLQGQSAQNIANQRALAGQLLAGQIGTTTTNLADLASSQGANLAGNLATAGSAGLNLQQTSVADSIQAQQAASAASAQSQRDYAAAQNASITNQPYTQKPPADYGGMIGSAFDAGAMMYNLDYNPNTGGFNTNYQAPSMIPQQQSPYAFPNTGYSGYPSGNSGSMNQNYQAPSIYDPAYSAGLLTGRYSY